MGTDGGPYSTLDNLTNQELVMEDLKTHMDVHKLYSANSMSAMPVRGGKVTQIERPSLTGECSDVTWKLFLKKWARYKMSIGISGRPYWTNYGVCWVVIWTRQQIMMGQTAARQRKNCCEG